MALKTKLKSFTNLDFLYSVPGLKNKWAGSCLWSCTCHDSCLHCCDINVLNLYAFAKTPSQSTLQVSSALFTIKQEMFLGDIYLFMAFNISMVTSTDRAMVMGWGSWKILQLIPAKLGSSGVQDRW